MKAVMRDSPCPSALGDLCKPASAPRSGPEATILVVPGGELSKQATGMPFAIGVHQRCRNGRLDLADAEVPCSPREFESVGVIAIPDQNLRRGDPRELDIMD